MLESIRSAAVQRLGHKFFYGWVILCVAMLGMFGTGPAQSHLIGIFFDPISLELGLPRTSIAAAYGSATLMAALLLPQVGKLIDHWGPASLLWMLATGLGLMAMVFSMVSNWVLLAVAFGCLRFLGQGAMMLTCVNMVSQWFDRKRGFALGLMSLGFPISMAVHPPLAQWLIGQVGWRQAWIWFGLITWVLIVPPALMLLYSKPEEINLRPDGLLLEDDPSASAGITGLTLSQALRTPAFYIICTGLFFLAGLVTSLHVENKGILSQHGLEPQTATLMFTVSGIMAALTMPIIGRMLDRFPTHLMFSGGLLVMSMSLLSVTFVSDLAGAIVYALIFGLNNGVTMTYFAFFWPRYFGRKHLGSIQGIGQMIGVVGASLGPLPLAMSLDYLGNYDPALRVLAVFPAICAIAALFLKPPALEDTA